MFEHLDPGGTLVLDHEVPYNDEVLWPYWTKERRRELPGAWNEPGDRRTASDGTEYELTGRLVDVDPLSQQVTMEMRGSMWRDGRLVEQDEHVLKMMHYFTNELRMTLERAGFVDIQTRGDLTGDEPTADTESIVYIARKALLREDP
jgi:hypothetical protein